MAGKIRTYMRGCLTVKLTGYSPERFLNLCSRNGIDIWDLVHVKDHYEFKISIGDFRKTRGFVRKSKARLIILERFGLPFFLQRYRKRKMFFIGLAMCFLLLYTLSLFIWDIHFEGNSTYTTDVLTQFLDEKGVHNGILKGQLVCDDIEQLIRLEYREITWVSAQIKGTRLIINIRENDRLMDVVEEPTDPCDLVAAKDGIITEIVTRRGVPQVKAGDVVTKGQLLVSGRVPVMNDNGEVDSYQIVHADADISAKTFYEYYDEFPTFAEKKVYTGNVKKKWYLRIGEFLFALPTGRTKYEQWDRVAEEYQMHLLDSLYLPVYAGIVQIREYRSYERQYTEEEILQIAQNRLEVFKENLKKKGVQIIENNVKIDTSALCCVSSGRIVVNEPIDAEQTLEQLEEIDKPDESDGNND